MRFKSWKIGMADKSQPKCFDPIRKLEMMPKSVHVKVSKVTHKNVPIRRTLPTPRRHSEFDVLYLHDYHH